VSEQSYWYVATAPLSSPDWDERCVCRFQGECVIVLQLFSTREGAENELCFLDDREPDAYLRTKDEYGEEYLNELLDNAPVKKVFEIGASLLGEHLEDSDFMYVMLDYEVMKTWELSEEVG
jgi:hypothetical protein